MGHVLPPSELPQDTAGTECRVSLMSGDFFFDCCLMTPLVHLMPVLSGGTIIVIQGFFSAFDRLSPSQQFNVFAQLEQFSIPQLETVILIGCDEKSSSSSAATVSAGQRSKEAWHVFFHMCHEDFADLLEEGAS